MKGAARERPARDAAPFMKLRRLTDFMWILPLIPLTGAGLGPLSAAVRPSMLHADKETEKKMHAARSSWLVGLFVLAGDFAPSVALCQHGAQIGDIRLGLLR